MDFDLCCGVGGQRMLAAPQGKGNHTVQRGAGVGVRTNQRADDHNCFQHAAARSFNNTSATASPGAKARANGGRENDHHDYRATIKSSSCCTGHYSYRREHQSSPGSCDYDDCHSGAPDCDRDERAASDRDPDPGIDGQSCECEWRGKIRRPQLSPWPNARVRSDAHFISQGCESCRGEGDRTEAG